MDSAQRAPNWPNKRPFVYGSHGAFFICGPCKNCCPVALRKFSWRNRLCSATFGQLSVGEDPSNECLVSSALVEKNRWTKNNATLTRAVEHFGFALIVIEYFALIVVDCLCLYSWYREVRLIRCGNDMHRWRGKLDLRIEFRQWYQGCHATF